MKDKVAVVTGGNSGIGKAIVLEFVSRGVKVVFCARREEEGKALETEIRSKGGDAYFIACDVVLEDQIKKVVDFAVDKFGRLDFGINNAGIPGPSISLHEYTEKLWDKVIDVNLKGTWLSMKHQIAAMLKSGGGSIVNVSSIHGINGAEPEWKISPYTASKHGVVGLTKSGALEYAERNIRINAVCPGFVKTDIIEGIVKNSNDPLETEKQMARLHPVNRIATPEEVAKVAVWLCSSDASFITGTALPVDGGYSAQ
ncbi:SDR family NAD(P)-dependent oxidoreductase [Leptospira stimsonii]|uniref:3-oxoacyl-ACP reductase n=1 Tax=Leptospira stimsonii TaxID=2202203 RepID=A0A8B3CVE2_9LEPT|nr:glucose 1-dehydrogenase [Leptospira stimsonii]RHX88629.1 3-oxoacyl-ACP reductase [Leptospira stimsonii]